MLCDDVVEQLLASDGPAEDAGVAQHVRGCARCARVAEGLHRLDGVLRTTLLVEPPLELQRSLLQLARTSARPRPASVWERASVGWRAWLETWLPRPNMAAAQGFAAIMLVLAGWQVFGWLNVVTPILGDVPYALQVLAASPALAYVGALQIDLQTLGLWTLIGGAGWLVSESSPITRYVRRRSRLP